MTFFYSFKKNENSGMKQKESIERVSATCYMKYPISSVIHASKDGLCKCVEFKGKQ